MEMENCIDFMKQNKNDYASIVQVKCACKNMRAKNVHAITASAEMYMQLWQAQKMYVQ